MSGASHRRRGDVVEEWRPDPADPRATVRGVRVRDTLREMWTRGGLSDAQWTAAERYRDDVATASGGGLGMLRLTVGGGGSGAGWLPGDAQVAARGRLRRAHEALGPRLGAVAEALVIGGLTLADGARRLRCAKAAAGDRLRETLDVLADHYCGRAATARRKA